MKWDGPLGMPLVKKIEKDIWEVRNKFKGGIARVLFTMDKGHMVLLHGFVKKTQNTPRQALEIAIKRAKMLRQI